MQTKISPVSSPPKTALGHPTAFTAPATAIPPIPAPAQELLRGPSILLMGAPGTGKTHSLTTLLEAGLELFVIVTEPGGFETLLDVCKSKKLDLSKLHYRVIEPARPGFEELERMATTVTQMSYKGLAEMGPTQRSNAQFLQVVGALSNFVDDRTSTAFGNVSKFGLDRVVAIDSLSGLSLMAMGLTIGNKVTAHQGEWGVAMNMLDKLLLSATGNLKCLFVLTAHIEREGDELSGGSKIMVSTLGRKLAPKVPRFFSEVVSTTTEGGKYYWNTSDPNMSLKHRSLPLGAKLNPSFAPIVAAYRQRLDLTGNQT